jgi:hypothetical protein
MDPQNEDPGTAVRSLRAAARSQSEATAEAVRAAEEELERERAGRRPLYADTRPGLERIRP